MHVSVFLHHFLAQNVSNFGHFTSEQPQAVEKAHLSLLKLFSLFKRWKNLQTCCYTELCVRCGGSGGCQVTFT